MYANHSLNVTIVKSLYLCTTAIPINYPSRNSGPRITSMTMRCCVVVIESFPEYILCLITIKKIYIFVKVCIIHKYTYTYGTVTRVHKSIGPIAAGPTFTLRYHLTLVCPLLLFSVVNAGKMHSIYHFIELTLIYDLCCALLPQVAVLS